MDESEVKIKDRIIGVARERFGHYGYGKTTMADLACDCNMSPGNLYRYFKGKIDIATEIARAESLAQIDRLRPLIECQYRSARQRLKEIFLQELRLSFHRLASDEKLVELIHIVMHERPRFMTESLRREKRLLSVVLEYGCQQNEFKDINVNQVAATLQGATMKFHYPQLFTQQSLDELEQELTTLLDLLFDGLLAPEKPSLIPNALNKALPAG